MKCFVNFSSIRPGIDLRSPRPFLATSNIAFIFQLAAALFFPFPATAHPEKTVRTGPGGTTDSLCQLVAVNDYAPLIVLADPAASQAFISFAQLLANDTLSDWPGVTISLVPDCGAGTAEPSPAIKVQLNPAGDGFLITGFLPGSWSH